jgi:hypothetical protein
MLTRQAQKLIVRFVGLSTRSASYERCGETRMIESFPCPICGRPARDAMSERYSKKHGRLVVCAAGHRIAERLSPKISERESK